jgi:hypothetical protein
MFTHTCVQSAPKRFLFIALVAGGEGPRLTKHLNEHIFISHFHDPEEGFPNLEDLENDGDSTSSVVRKKAIDDQIEEATDPVLSASVSMSYRNYGVSVLMYARILRLSKASTITSPLLQKSTAIFTISLFSFAFIERYKEESPQSQPNTSRNL